MLFAALNVLTGKVIGQCHGWHRHQEFVKFLRRLDDAFPPDITLHFVLDNYGTDMHEAVRQWLAAHPRFRRHITPIGASWLNLVRELVQQADAAASSARHPFEHWPRPSWRMGLQRGPNAVRMEHFRRHHPEEGR